MCSVKVRGAEQTSTWYPADSSTVRANAAWNSSSSTTRMRGIFGLRSLQHLQQLAVRGLDLGGLGVAGVRAGVDGFGEVEEVAGGTEHQDGGVIAVGFLPCVLDDAVPGAVGEPHVDEQAVGQRARR